VHILGHAPAVVNFEVVIGVCLLSLACRSPEIPNPDYCLYEGELCNLAGWLWWVRC